ncbi:MAG: phosphohydrolase [Candidatus Marinimicrobia bacterium]|nr:phosphohydrolase [Candidatus Neomarinimicrobiota bacterium]
MFFIIFLTVLGLMHGYVGWRIFKGLDIKANYKILAIALVVIFTLLPVLPIAFRYIGYESSLLDVLSLIGYTGLGFFFLTFLLFITKDIVTKSWSFISSFFPSDIKQQITIDLEKRQFLQKSLSVGILTLVGPTTAYGYYSARKGPSIINQTIFLNDLPDAFENFTIAQISDLHVGPTIKKPYVEKVLNQISIINPDLIAITGDLIDGSIDYLKKDLEPLSEMIANYGTYFVTGNHEYYSGAEKWLDETDRMGFTNLVNEHDLISINNETITLAGVTDFRAHQIIPSHKSNPKNALRGSTDQKVKILLAHQPSSIFKANEAGYDFQISGHTHGGQFWPFTYPTKKANPYLSGLHNHNGTQIYVNSGTGYWGPPLRLGVPSEITLFKLKKKVS